MNLPGSQQLAAGSKPAVPDQASLVINPLAAAGQALGGTGTSQSLTCAASLGRRCCALNSREMVDLCYAPAVASNGGDAPASRSLVEPLRLFVWLCAMALGAHFSGLPCARVFLQYRL